MGSLPGKCLEILRGRVQGRGEAVRRRGTLRRSPSFRAREWKYSYDGFLSPPMFASRIRALTV